MKAAKVWSLLLLVAPAWCSTKILMHNVSSPVSGYRYATLTRGQGLTTSVTNSVNGPTSGVQLTKTAGGAAMVWISPPLATAATISGTVTMNAYAAESQTACNCGMQVTMRKYSGGAEGATVLNSERGTELGTTISLQNWTGLPRVRALRSVIASWCVGGSTMQVGIWAVIRLSPPTTMVRPQGPMATRGYSSTRTASSDPWHRTGDGDCNHRRDRQRSSFQKGARVFRVARHRPRRIHHRGKAKAAGDQQARELLLAKTLGPRGPCRPATEREAIFRSECVAGPTHNPHPQ